MEVRNTFIDEVILRLQTEGIDFSQVCLLAPSRRAVVYFRRALAQTVEKPMWAPKMAAIQDLLCEASGKDFPEDMTLVSVLYGAFEEIMRQSDTGWEESFASFYAWGSMILKDFDDLDRQLAPVDDVFRNLEDLQEIDAFFEGEEEEREALRWFREALLVNPEQDGLRAKFLGIWGTLRPLYHRFQAHLSARGWSYDGRAFREAAESPDLDHVFPYHYVIFVGFNALTRAEEKLADRLAEAGKLRMFWDADRLYEPEPGQEAWLGPEIARFVRRYHDRWKDKGSEIIFHDRTASPAEIHLIGAPYQVTQALELRALLGDSLTHTAHPERQAVVLADEGLLLPVLKHLPEVAALNITMGFPLKFTPVYQFLMKVLELQATAEPIAEAAAGNSLETSGLLELLSHPFFLSLDQDLISVWQKKIQRENLLRVSLPQLEQAPGASPLWRLVFREPVQSDWPAYFDAIFMELKEYSAESTDPVEGEILMELYTRLNLLREVLRHLGQQPDRKGFARLFREVMRSARVPFEGEPLQGLQIMGFLETRVLDFETVYLLGANEGFLPPSSAGNSFIPFNLRKAYRLPTYEDQDAIAAYHFFRLLQRPKKVFLFFNTSIQENGSSREESRFLLQILYFLNRAPLTLIQRRVTLGVENYPPPVIAVPASADTRTQLLTLFGNAGKRYLSASALTSYLTCSLQFYFRYLAGIREPDELATSLDGQVVGKVMHGALEQIYKAMIGTSLTMPPADVINEALMATYSALFDGNKDWADSGINGVYNQILFTLIESQVRRDLNDVTFQVAQVEFELKHVLEINSELSVQIGGVIDRLDALSGGIRVVDYKSGAIEIKKNTDLEKIFEAGNPAKFLLQGMVYTWLLHSKPGYAMPQAVSFYPIGSKNKEKIDFPDSFLTPDTVSQFETEMKKLIEQMFYQPYVQTTVLKNCGYCPYAGICQR